jgi:arsenate reductase (thioredoxin)
MKKVIGCIVLLAFFAAAQNPPPKNEPKPRHVVFVCEHGAALSVIAAAYFNKLAHEQHLDYQAVARGVTPQEDLSTQAVAGLKKDGLAAEIEKPIGISQSDLDAADLVVAFVPLPEKLAPKSPVEDWSDVKWGPGSYERSRDAILKHMHELFDKLKTEKQ